MQLNNLDYSTFSTTSTSSWQWSTNDLDLREFHHRL